MKIRPIILALFLTACSPSGPAPGMTFDGVGAVFIGMSFAEAEKAVGHKLRVRDATENTECWYTHRADMPLPKVHYMMNGNTVRRIDVHDPDIKTGGGVGVGTTQDDAIKAYDGKLKVELSKYLTPDQGNNLAVDSESGDRRIIFATQIPENGTQKVVTSARVGFKPEVDYVEGCS